MVEMEFGELAVFITDEIGMACGEMNKKHLQDGKAAASFIEYRLIKELKGFFEESDGEEHDNSCEKIEMDFSNLSWFIQKEIKHFIKRFQEPYLSDGEQAAYFIKCTLVDHLRSFFDDLKVERGIPVQRNVVAL